MKVKMLLAALVSMMLSLCLFGCGGEDYEGYEDFEQDDEMISSVMDNEDDDGFGDEDDEDEDDD